MSDLYERRQVTANRPHKCHLCGETIPAGVDYIREKWRDDGFHEIKRHIHCDALLDEYFSSDSFFGEYFDNEVWDWIREKCLDLCGYDEFEDCIDNPFSCEGMIGTITNVNSRRAAFDSLNLCRERTGR